MEKGDWTNNKVVLDVPELNPANILFPISPSSQLARAGTSAFRINSL
jgi:hypothetical protein